MRVRKYVMSSRSRRCELPSVSSTSLTSLCARSSSPLRIGVAQQAHAHAHVSEALGERVVHFVGQHLPLAGEADAHVLAGEARVVERGADEIADRAQERRHGRGRGAGGREPQGQRADRLILMAQRHRHHVLAHRTKYVARQPLVVAAKVVAYAFAVGVARLGARRAPRGQRAHARYDAERRRRASCCMPSCPVTLTAPPAAPARRTIASSTGSIATRRSPVRGAARRRPVVGQRCVGDGRRGRAQTHRMRCIVRQRDSSVLRCASTPPVATTGREMPVRTSFVIITSVPERCNRSPAILDRAQALSQLDHPPSGLFVVTPSR